MKECVRDCRKGGVSSKSVKASLLSHPPCPTHPFHLDVPDLHPCLINWLSSKYTVFLSSARCSNKLIQPQGSVTGTSDLQPIVQKHRWQHGLGMDVGGVQGETDTVLWDWALNPGIWHSLQVVSDLTSIARHRAVAGELFRWGDTPTHMCLVTKSVSSNMGAEWE